MRELGFHDIQVTDANADLNVYSKLAGTDGGERYLFFLFVWFCIINVNDLLLFLIKTCLLRVRYCK